MSEFNFILITIFLVLFIVFIVNKTLSKRNTKKKNIQSQEKFSENLNDLDTIVDGVSLKKQTENIDKNDVDEETDELETDEKESHDNNIEKSKNEKEDSSTKKKINLKDSIISKEILERRKKL